MSGRQDSNLRPPGPKPGAMTGLRYIPILAINKQAEGEGFEPSVPLRVRQFSKLLVSATHPSLREADNLRLIIKSFRLLSRKYRDSMQF